MSVRSLARIRSDFDRIAALPEPVFEPNAEHHEALLALLPARRESALELGCGTGRFTRRLAGACDRVLGLDLSERMVERARRDSVGIANVRYESADLLAVTLPPASFDVVVAIATLHHLPLSAALARAAGWVRPGGRLLVLDLFRAVSLTDHALSACSVLQRSVSRLTRGFSGATPREVRAAWDAHGRGETYPSLAEVRAAAACLPGAVLHRRLSWRYLLCWTRPLERDAVAPAPAPGTPA